MQEKFPNTKMTQSDQELLKEVFDVDEKYWQDQREKVALAKQNTKDKEVFDISAFGEFYNITGMLGKPLISPEVIEEYEREYYLKHPEIKSLEEFAKYKQEFERHDEA